MKNRDILLMVVLFGIQVATQTARAALPTPAAPAIQGNRDKGFLGPQLGGNLWNASATTVDPNRLIPDDSADSRPLFEFNAKHFESTFGRGSFELANTFKG